MTRDTAERAREIVKQFDQALKGDKENLDDASCPYTEFDVLETVLKKALPQIQAEARLDPKQAKLAILALQHYKTACSKSGSAFQDSIDSAIAALAQALQQEEKEGES